MSRGPASLLVDAAGNIVGVVNIGGTYHLQTEVNRIVSELPAGSQIIGLVGVDPAQTGGLAEEATLLSVDTTATSIDAVLKAIRDTAGIKKITDALPAGTNIIGQVGVDPAQTGGLALEATLSAAEAHLGSIDASVDVALSTRATEATLTAADAKLATIDAVLDSIKDTDGVKRINDALPAGANEIGAVAQGTKAAPADAWPAVLYDASGNPIGVIADGSIWRIQAEAKIVGDSGVSADVNTEGARNAQAVEYPELLAAVEKLSAVVHTLASQLATITGEDDPL